MLPPLFKTGNGLNQMYSGSQWEGLDMSGFNPTGPQTMDMSPYTLNGKTYHGSSSWANKLQEYLNSTGQGDAFSFGGSGSPVLGQPKMSPGQTMLPEFPGNPVNNPYGFTGGAGGRAITPWTNSVTGQTWNAPSTGYQPPNSNWQQQSPNIFQNNTMGNSQPSNFWGAPDAYRNSFQSNSGNQSNIFGNPYSAGGNNFYNPYQFGQTIPGNQYSGSTELPWWMTYSVDTPAVTPPTTSVQPPVQTQTPTRPQGTGPNGKDLTYDETIKYFGLYDNAESALAAGDSQAAYRKDHMQWRSGTGHYAGMGEGQGQYPGRPDLGIAGDAERLSNLSGMFGGFNPLSLFNREQNERGGTDYTVANEGTFVTPGGTTVETQLTRNSNLQAQQDFSINKIDEFLKAGNTNPFNVPYGPEQGGVEQTYVIDDGGSFIESDIPTPNIFDSVMANGPIGRGSRGGKIDPRAQYNAGPAEKTMFEINNPSFNMDNEYAPGSSNAIDQVVARAQAQQLAAANQAKEAAQAQAAAQAKAQARQQEQAKAQAAQRAQLEASLEAQRVQAEQARAQAQAKAQAKANAEAKAKAQAEAKAAQDRKDAARRQNNNYSTGPVAKRSPSPKPAPKAKSTGGRGGRGNVGAQKSTTTSSTSRIGGRYGL